MDLGTQGEIDVQAVELIDGRYKKLDRGGTKFRARCYYKGWDGVRDEISRIADSKSKARKEVEDALKLALHTGESMMKPTTPFIEAGQRWLENFTKNSEDNRTPGDYAQTWQSYVAVEDSGLYGLNLAQVNNAQQLRTFLDKLATKHGPATLKKTKTVVSNVLTFAVKDQVLESNAMALVRTPKGVTKDSKKDTKRAMTREQRDHLIAYAYGLCPSPIPEAYNARRTWFKWRSTADLLAIQAGLGMRIDEVRRMLRTDADLDTGVTLIRGTKSDKSLRRGTMPVWLRERLRERRALLPSSVLLVPSPLSTPDRETAWDQSGSANAAADVLTAAGFEWAVPHTLRRTVATLLEKKGIARSEIADLLGNDEIITSTYYIGENPMNPQSDLADLL